MFNYLIWKYNLSMKILNIQESKEFTSYIIEVDPSLWKDNIKQATNYLTEKQDRPSHGFLPFGRAKYHASEEEILNEATNIIFNFVYKWLNLEFDKKPNHNINLVTWWWTTLEMTREKLVLGFNFENVPTAKVAIIENLSIPEFKPKKVSNKKIDDFICKHAKEAWLHPLLSRPAKKGDMIEIDQQFIVDGVPNEQAKYNRIKVQVGDGRGFPELDKELIGIKKDETRMVKIQGMSDKDKSNDPNVGCWVKVHSYGIVDKNNTSFLCNEVAEQFMIDGIKTIDELRECLRTYYNNKHWFNFYEQQIGKIYEYMSKNTQLSFYPTRLEEYFYNSEKEVYEKEAQENNMDIKDFVEKNCYPSYDKFLKIIMKKAKDKTIDTVLILNAAKKLNIEYTQQEFFKDLQLYCCVNGYYYDGICKSFEQKEEMRICFLFFKVAQKIVNQLKNSMKS